MKKILKISLLIVLVLILVIISFPEDANAFGLISKPIEINSALRGETIQETLRIFNSKNEIDIFQLTTSGDAGDWVNFYISTDLDNPVTTVSGPAESYFDTIIYLKIPEDISNGEYSGKITISTIPKKIEGEGAIASVLQKLSREILINVTDREMIILNASIIANTFGLYKGETLQIRVIYDNQGNVSLKPQVQVRIKKMTGDVVYNAIFPYSDDLQAIKPLAQQEISILEIPTTGISNGTYMAELNFIHNNEVILEEDFKFSIDSKITFLGSINNIINSSVFKYILIVMILIFTSLVLVFIKKSKHQKMIFSKEEIIDK